LIKGVDEVVSEKYKEYIDKRVSEMEFEYKMGQEIIYGLKFKEWVNDNEFEIRRRAINQSQNILNQKLTDELKLIHDHFSFNPKDIKYVGRFVDLIIFDGSSSDKEVTIYFVEIIKQNSNTLSNLKLQVDNAITNGRYSFQEIYL
jgi:predicted Holliday junction resolvase-like endonuclease